MIKIESRYKKAIAGPGGFTIIELMIALLLAAIVTSAALSINSLSFRTRYPICRPT